MCETIFFESQILFPVFGPPILIFRRLNTITKTGNISETVIAVTGRVLDLSDIIVVL